MTKIKEETDLNYAEIKKHLENTIYPEIIKDPDLYKADDDYYQYRILEIGSGHQGRYKPDQIAEFFGPVNLGYIVGTDGSYYENEEGERFDKISDDPYAWEAIDEFDPKYAEHLDKKINQEYGNFFFGHDDHGDYCLYIAIASEEFENLKEEYGNKS